jgi:hypothetical protein
LSARSRLRSHRAEAFGTGLHSSLGSIHPSALWLQLTRLPGEATTYDDTIADLAVLLHERHHWLQHVGTSAGMFGSTLLSVQTAVIQHNVPLDALRPDDLPLLGREGSFPSALGMWERLEATRRLYFGCRPADLVVLRNDGRAPMWRELGPLLDPVVEHVLADGSEMARLLAVRDHPSLALEPSGILVREAGWSMGARHLMEGAARLNEVLHLLKGALDLHREYPVPAEPFRFDLNGRFTGEYAVARRMFQSVVGEPTAAAEVGFAFACDLALNCLAPPFYAFPPHNPGTYFAHVVRKLASFRFDRVIDIADPTDTRTLFEELTEHVGEDLTIPVRMRRVMATRFLGHLRPDNVAQEIFAVGHDFIPSATGPGSRQRYEFALSAEAERIRARSPEVFVLPFAAYVADRAAFRALFERIQPPLLSFGDRGITPTRGDPGWLEFFLATGVHGELLRAIVVLDTRGVARRLVPYLRSVAGVEHGHAVVRRVVRGLFDGGPVADEILRHVAAAAGK